MDRLTDVFTRQTEFMEMLREKGKVPEWPVDLASKSGQRIVKNFIFDMFEEMTEASATLKNKMHRLTDAREIDRDHYCEELGDAFAYFIEICIMSGIGPDELFAEYARKNAIVRERLRSGY